MPGAAPGVPSTTPTGSPAGGGGVKSAGASGAQGPSSSGSFTDVGKYIQANAPALGRLTEAVTGGATQKLQAAEASAKKQAETGIADIKAKGTSASPYTQKGVSEISDIEGARNLLQGSAPVEAGRINTDNLQATQNFAKLANQGLAGKKAALSQEIGGDVKDYSAGERSLDALFLQRDPAAKSSFTKLQELSDRVGGSVAESQKSLDEAAKAQTGLNTRSQEDISKYLQDQWSGLSGGYEGIADTRQQGVMGAAVDPVTQAVEYLKAGGNPSNMSENLYNVAQAVIDSGGRRINEQGLSMPGQQGDAGQIALDMFMQSGGGNVFQGINSADQAALENLIAITQGSNLADVTSGAKELLGQGVYDEAAAQQAFMDWLGGMRSSPQRTSTGATGVVDPVSTPTSSLDRLMNSLRTQQTREEFI